ncbi:hypothetical protein GH714_019989 [Hevea brasiliensis]|uniref:PDZ domain-containing protein n=1 Tax=Hevea brasiliensis TaxID=3981 RepID=A0A6A6M291_HEVBR|nr:hypothetical protein GH714_019989 [Hevea brasiliensis]
MSSAVVAGSSSSCSTTFTRNHSIKAPPTASPKPILSSPCQRTAFQGLSLQDAKRGSSEIFIAEKKNNFTNARRGLQITARTAGASKTIEVDVDKPLGLTLGQKSGGGVVITAVDGGGNAAKAGLKAGDQVLYTSSFFGDELWPADKLGFTKTAIQAKPDSVYFIVNSSLSFYCFHIGAEVDVKKLTKRPAPPRFGRKLTEAQKAMQAFSQFSFALLQCSMLECSTGYICMSTMHSTQKRFARYDVNTGKAIGGGLPPVAVIIGLVAGVGAVGALLAYGLQ